MDEERGVELADMADHVLAMQKALLQSQSEMIVALQRHIERLESQINEYKTVMGVMDQ
jgi:hypothetical protein